MKAICVVFVALWIVSRFGNGSSRQKELVRGFRGSELDYLDERGFFLFSNSSVFAFGFTAYGSNGAAVLLSVVHQGSAATVWTANRGAPVLDSDDFVFDNDGNAYLQSGGGFVWSTNTSGMGATRMVLLDSGNLVLLGDAGDDSSPLWQSFRHPTDTLLSGQSFTEGMSLVSNPNDQGLRYQLRIESGDAKLFAGFRSLQPYWSMSGDSRRIVNEVVRGIHSAVLEHTSWNFYDHNQTLIWEFIVQDSFANETLAAFLNEFGFISFSALLNSSQEYLYFENRIPLDSCDTPEHCDPYYICSSGDRCQCPEVLSSYTACNSGASSFCDSTTAFNLVKLDDGVGYFASDYMSPTSNSNLTRCKDACSNDCTCVALFHDERSGNCVLFDQIVNLKRIQSVSSLSAYVKVPSNGDGGNQSNGHDGPGSRNIKISITVITISFMALSFLALWIRRRKKAPGPPEEDNFLESISGRMPVKFTYRELQAATNNFSEKLGEGGFGSVYLGKLSDGTKVAVKKLEGLGQGNKEFHSEVSIIGSIHHIHLVKLRGFCAEGAHRLLAYEFMANGSLDRWIFSKNEEGFALDWEKRYSIAVGTAKGLAYLHEGCESKIVHCDIKPENVLLDENFLPKLSDFGLAKLMTREQSHAFTTLRGTRGYLAPEWIVNYSVSEKSDVYSYGMVLLEILGGRKNFDPMESSEKAYFPTYAFKKMAEGKSEEIVDAKLRYNDDDGRVGTAIRVALWCIQEEVRLRPSMMQIVRMLEGLQEVSPPPVSTQLRFRLYAYAFEAINKEEGACSSGPVPSRNGNAQAFEAIGIEEGTSSRPVPLHDENAASLSAVSLSGPR